MPTIGAVATVAKRAVAMAIPAAIAVAITVVPRRALGAGRSALSVVVTTVRVMAAVLAGPVLTSGGAMVAAGLA